MGSREGCFTQSEQLWILAFAAAAVAGSFILQPATGNGLCLPGELMGAQIDLPQSCMFRHLTGIDCPGCGLTRSFVHMAQADICQAFRFNAMGPILYVICLLQIPYRISEYYGLWKSSHWWPKIRKRLDVITWFLVAGLVAAWVLRLF